MKPTNKKSLLKMKHELDKIEYEYFCEDFSEQCWLCPLSPVCNFYSKVTDKINKLKKEEREKYYSD